MRMLLVATKAVHRLRSCQCCPSSSSDTSPPPVCFCSASVHEHKHTAVALRCVCMPVSHARLLQIIGEQASWCRAKGTTERPDRLCSWTLLLTALHPWCFPGLTGRRWLSAGSPAPPGLQ